MTLGIRKGKESKIPAFFHLIHTLPPRQLGSCSVSFGVHQDISLQVLGVFALLQYTLCEAASHNHSGKLSQTPDHLWPCQNLEESAALLIWGAGMTSSESCQRIPRIMSCINSADGALSASLCLIKHLDYSLASTD